VDRYYAGDIVLAPIFDKIRPCLIWRWADDKAQLVPLSSKPQGQVGFKVPSRCGRGDTEISYIAATHWQTSQSTLFWVECSQLRRLLKELNDTEWAGVKAEVERQLSQCSSTAA
jgi:hypothetical protein